jgi:hypothetical protein
MNGKKNWYIVDGYRPFPQPVQETAYEGHECIMILNCNDKDANVLVDIYFEDRDPVEDIPLKVKAKRIFAFRTGDRDLLGGVELKVNQQYSLRIRSDIEVVVQYGRCDVVQPNLAYIGLLGYSE